MVKEQVIWKSKAGEVIWYPTRTPALGWTDLTILEALADSSKVLLGFGNYKRVADRLNKILKILRYKIERAKRDSHTLLNRCEFRETKRTRCNRTPVQLYGKEYLCKRHSRN